MAAVSKRPIEHNTLNNTYSTELRRVVYRWHAYHDQTLVVRFEKRDALKPVVHCEVPETEGKVCVEVPSWMFEGTSCSRMRLKPAPQVSWDALSALAQLLRDTVASAFQEKGESNVIEPTSKAQKRKGHETVVLALPVSQSVNVGSASRGRERASHKVGKRAAPSGVQGRSPVRS